MKIAQVNFYRYELPFKQPMMFKNQMVHLRKGLLVCLESDKGVEGYGDIAPLPGFSRESYEQVEEQARLIKPSLVGTELPKNPAAMDGQLSKWLQDRQLRPSLRMGLEMALLNLVANSKDVGLNELLSDDPHDDIRVHGLLRGNIEEVVEQALELSKRGFIAMKLKVGGHLEEDIEKVQALNDALGGRAILHVDANRRWNYEQALEFGRKVSCAAIEYIEEPFADIERIPEFFQETMIPVALDESLASMKFEDVKRIDGVDYVILKPTVLGGMEKTVQMMREAQSVALNAVISSSFESGVGTLSLAHLAGTANYHLTTGLDTLKYFQRDVLLKDLTIERGILDISNKWISRDTLDFDVLQLLS